MEGQYKVLIADKVAPEAHEVFGQYENLTLEVKTGMAPEELLSVIGDYHGLVVRSATKVTKEVLEKAINLKVIGRAGIGVDNIDVAEASRRGVVVMNTPDSSAITTAEHAVAMMMSVIRNIPRATSTMKDGQWLKSKLKGREIYGKTLGVLGLGNIGRRVAERALGLGMKVMAYDPFTSEKRAKELNVELVDLDQLFTRADAITCHTPLTDETRNLIRKETLAKMKEGVFIINCSRGGVVNEGDLAEAIESGKVGGAALDVFVQEPPAEDNPLLKLDNFICTPHLGGSTTEAQAQIARAISSQIGDYLIKDEIRNALNFPSVPKEMKEILIPYITLGEKVGQFAGQYFGEKFEKVEISFEGKVATYPIQYIAAAVQKGVLHRTHSSVLNYVNAPILLKEHGIEVEETLKESSDFTSAIAIRLTGGEKVLLVRGVLSNTKAPRIVQVNQFPVEVVPEGTILILRNPDKPGVIGNVGSALGTEGINISRLQLGLDPDTNHALSFWGVDSEVSEQVLDKLRSLDNVDSASVITMV